MKLIQQLKVAFKTIVVMTGFCAMMVGWPGDARAQNPSASFTSNVFTGCAPLSVDFVNMSTQANSYFWDFGNGNTSTLTDPTTVYLTSGFYTVRLVAINSLTGNRDTLTATNYINVVNNPTANFTATSLTGCVGNNAITFNNLSVSATSYIWDFGDGTFSTQANPTHSYTGTGVYTVKLIARNSFNCTSIHIQPSYITIVPNPAAAFTVNQQSSCDINQVFNFTCSTAGSIGWQWNFGDGNTSSLQNPTHVYGASGTYDVTLIVTNPGGCIDTLVQSAFINIGATLVPFFSVNSPTGCPPFNAIFNCNVPNATSWAWNFGDGTTSTIQNPSHLYSTPGSFTITLAVTTSSGCNGTVTLPGFIVVDQIPVPSFTVANPVGCDPHSTAFTNTSTNASTYLWNFGDGNTSTGFNPTNVFVAPGTYNVTLTAISANGCSASTTQNTAVTVNTFVGALNAGPRTGCAPLPVTFSGISTPTATSWQWNFGDGNTATGQNVNHTYTAIGNYTVTLIMTSPLGCIDTIVKPTHIRVYPDSVPYVVPDTILVCTPPGTVSFTDPTAGSSQWLWDFGNGVTSTIRNPTYAYTVPGIYTVTLTTNMSGGCSQTFNPYAIINVIPLIVSPITQVLVSPCGPYTINFDNGTLNIATYLWDFGDGTTSTLQSPVHTYTNPGTYTITLLLVSINGCQTSLSTSITVGHQNPITVSDNAICLSDVVNFGLNSPSAYTTVLWNFGDGNTSGLVNPSHTYTTAGSFNVSVTVTDTLGCVITFNAPPVIVSDPIPSFVVNQPTEGCIPFDVQFTNTSLGATSYSWDFGDGTNSTATNPSHSYTVADTFTVILTASDIGCTRSITQTNLIITHAAAPDFSFTPNSGCLPLTVTFTDLSLNPISWLWDFGDGNTSTLQNPVHTYTTIPTGLIRLIIVDVNGCIKSKARANVVPVAPDIIANTTLGCIPLTVNFSTTLAATSYLWDFGDGLTSTLQNPVHTYTSGGLYTVSLTCVLASGCTTTTVNPDFINVASPVSDFMSPTLAVCAPSLVSFVNQTTGATTYLWDFGDGTTSTNSDPSHIYNIPGTYTVTLISTSGSGCSDTITKVDYIVVPGTFSDFTSTSQTACLQTFAQFVDQSINATSWFWNFGDGFTSTLQNPSHTYADTGSYTVTLITSDSVGCSSFFSSPNPIIVHPNPVASGSVVSTVGCSPFVTAFLNTSTGGTNYIWHFGNGDSSTNANPVYSYPASGSYQVSLVAITSFGCTDTFTLPTNITVNATPVAAFSPNVASGCEPLTVNFTNQSAPLSNPNYLWNFGNSQTSGLPNPSVTFATAGVYQVQLVVVNTGGCNDTVSHTITVLPSPVAIASASSYVGCSPLPVTFTNTSTGATSYSWNFGDGATSTIANPSHTFSASGNYQVTLIATGGNGCTDTLVLPTSIVVNQTPVVNFSRTPFIGCEPLSVTFTDLSSQLNNPTYSWDFGNGTTSTTQSNPPVVYTSNGIYPVTLIVTNTGGCADTLTKNVTVHPSPVAAATASSNIGCSPFAVTFTNTTTGATSYLWDFGDGTTSAGVSPVHNYSTAGVYNVTLIATNANGCADTLVLSSPITVNESPIANFSRTPFTGCAPLAVAFNNLSSMLSNPTYAWNFANGLTSTSANNTPVTYSTPGLYNITLIVTNDNGCIDSVTKGITVYDIPVAAAAMSDSVGCAPFAVTFTNATSGINTYVWNFGDGTTSTTTSPSHSYTVPGTYIVSLVATTPNGCKDTLVFSTPVHVNTTPVATFTRTPASGCTPLNVFFNSTSTQLVNPAYSWNFGNGQIGNQPSANISYATAGTFPVTLTVTNDNGCTSTIIKNIVAHQTPDAIAAVSGNTGCAPYSVSFSNNSIAATSYVWNFGDGSTSILQTPSHTYTTPGDYTVTLIAIGASGCSDTLIINPVIHVKPTPTAVFSSSVVNGCAPLSVAFTDQSTGLDSPLYSWNMGNGQTSNSQNTSAFYTNSGTYSVTQIVTNAEGCTDTATTTIVVNPLPVASASVQNQVGCSPLTATFQNNSTGATGNLWNFGDGATSTNANPSHTYTTAGSFIVSLVASNQFGCTDTFVFNSPVVVNQTPVAAFTPSTTGGCTPVNVNFVNQSSLLDSPVYAWNLGNGQTGSTSGINGAYTTGGVYNVSMIVTNQGGCSDTALSAITVYDNPIVSASTTDTVGCTPHTANFINNTINGVSYLWNFGDGTTSTQQTPSHIYNTAGNYTVTLIVGGAGACGDTLVLPYTIHVKATPSASFGPATVVGCTPLNVAFNNTSTGLVGPNYNWIFGNGITSTVKDPSVTYLQGGLFNVVLVVTNNEGCTDTATAVVTANLTPVAQASAIDTIGCAPHQVNFISSSLFSSSILWNLGDGTTSTLQNLQHTYAVPGTYVPYLVAYSTNGCSDTAFFAAPVKVNPVPTAAFAVNQTASCSGTTFQFQSLSTPTTGLTYNWSIGGSTYTVQNPTVPIMNPGFYNVSLVVTNQFGCADTLDEPNYIMVFDTIPPPATPILSVSVLNNTSVEITWQNSSVLDLGEYVLYRKNLASGIYDEIYRDINPNNSSMSVTSAYVDNGLNTLQNVYTYKLLAIDKCAFSLPLTALNPHTTINVTATPINDKVNVSWTRYLGCAVSSYEINRVNLSDGTSSLIATVPPNTLTYLDQNFYCPNEFSYRITATSLCGNIYTSLSDTSIAQPANPLAAQKVEIVRTTVIDDRNVLTEWLPPTLAPNRVAQYNVMKSTDNVNYTEIATLPANALSYIDYDTDVHNQDYFYRIDVVSDCELTGVPSNNGASILLKSDWEREKTKLWWTPYTDWNTGVDFYIIEQESPFGQWLPVKTVDGNELNTILDE